MTGNDILNPKDLESFLGFDLTNIDFGSFAETISYNGFNPVITFNIIRKIIGKDKERFRDLCFIITFGLRRGFGNGKSLSDIIDKTNEKGRDQLMSAIRLFGIRFEKPKKNTDVTISRIMTAFPYHTFTINRQLLEAGNVKYQDYDGDLPEIFRYPGSPAMMSRSTYERQKSNYINFVQYLSGLWNAEFDEEIAIKFSDLAYSSQLSPMDKRE